MSGVADSIEIGSGSWRAALTSPFLSVAGARLRAWQREWHRSRRGGRDRARSLPGRWHLV